MRMDTIKLCRDEQLYTLVRPLDREINFYERHSCIYQVQDGTVFCVARSVMNKRFRDARENGRKPNEKMLFSNFSVHVT